MTSLVLNSTTSVYGFIRPILVSIYNAMISASKARAAAELGRMGNYEGAKHIMLDESMYIK